jgi:membrane-associated phospholipid phosphatase
MNKGIAATLQQIKLFFVPYLILLCICLTIKFVFSRQDIYFAVNSRYSDWGDYIFPYITYLGDGWTIIILSAILALFNYRAAFLMATSYGITAVLAQIIKRFVGAPRPKLFFTDQLSRIHFIKGFYIDSLGSFPSGHTVTAFSAALVAAYLIKNKNWSVPLLFLAMLIGFSRMYVSEHFFEDVIGGSVIGVIVTVMWLTWLDTRKFLHSPKWHKGLLSRP